MICVVIFLLNVDSLCVIRIVCQTQILLFFVQRLTFLMQRAITHWGCTALCVCMHEWLSGRVCVCVWDKDHLCSQGSQWIWSQSALCQLAFDLSLSRLGLRLSYLAGHTRFSPSFSLSAFPFSSPCTQGACKGSPLGQDYWHAYLIARGSNLHLSVSSV